MRTGSGYTLLIWRADARKPRCTAQCRSRGRTLGNGVGSVDGKIRFDARKMLNRPALLLSEGTLYLAFTSHLDGEPKFDYHGWIVAYDAKTLKQIAILNTTPDGIQGGFGRVEVARGREARGDPSPDLRGRFKRECGRTQL